MAQTTRELISRETEGPVSQPNIVIFNPDHFRAEALAHLGNPAAVTPNLDRIAREEGVSFANAFCQNPVCTPSRCSFMSGWYPHVAGHRTIHHLMHPHEPVLLRMLKAQGYHVWWGGKNDIAAGQLDQTPYRDVRYRGETATRAPIDCGPDAPWRGGPESDGYYSFYYGCLDKGGEAIYRDPDWDNVLEAIDVIRRGPRQPFCLFLALSYPHPSFAVEEPFYSMIDRGKLPPRAPAPEDWSTKPSMLKGIAERTGLSGWSEERWNELRATYYGMCARLDHQYGLILDALRETGLYDDTAVFFFSDHGTYAGHFDVVDITQNTFDDCQTRMPFVVKPAAKMPVKPGVRHALVELLDFPATVFDMLDVEPGTPHFGRSLMPVIAGETDEHRDAVFSEGGRLAHEEHCKELEYAPGTVPGDIYYPRLSFQAGDGPEHTKAVMCRTHQHKYVMRLYEQDELYDLKRDPLEQHNRINDPDMADVAGRMKERLLRFFLETADVVPMQSDLRDAP